VNSGQYSILLGTSSRHISHILSFTKEWLYSCHFIRRYNKHEFQLWWKIKRSWYIGKRLL